MGVRVVMWFEAGILTWQSMFDSRPDIPQEKRPKKITKKFTFNEHFKKGHASHTIIK